MKKYSFLIICTLLTSLLFTTCEPWIVPEAVFVNFNANGGQGDMKAQRFEDGEKQALTKNTYTRNGYIFDGWNTRSDGRGQLYADRQNVSITKSVTLYAQWRQKQVISGTENGHDYVDLGLPSGLKWATCNVGATAPEGYGDYFAWGETSPKDNYDWSTYKYCNGSYLTLTKYNTKSDYGTVDNKTTLDLSDDAARANWGGKWRMPTQAEHDELIKNCTWTWTIQDGVKGYKVASRTNGNSIFLPAAGSRYGTSVDFVGSSGGYWSSSLSESDPYNAFLLYFISDYVDWCGSYRDDGHPVRAVCGNNTAAQTFTLTFNANGGTGTMAAQTFEAGVSQAITANTFTRSGYTFTGWNTNADGSGTSYTDKQSITLSQDITLYAQWKKDIVNYTITFNANGGTGTMAAQTFEAGVSQAITANTFTRSGYTFTGWNTKADGSGTSYTDKQSITLSQDITLYAQWKKNIVNYTVTFNANGGTGTMAAQTFEAGVSQAITANTFTRSGYTFTGWNTNADGGGTSYTDKQSITLTQDITLYAQWESAGGSGGGSSISGTENGHDYVDLGLPSGLKWATCNVGATTPEAYGDYFAWGETSPKDNYVWSTYKYCNGSYDTMTKYCTNSNYGYNRFTDNKTILELSDDAARVTWGGNWRMPTYAELDELSNNCTWTRTTQNGVSGYKVTSKTNGNSIFLPAAGHRGGTTVYSEGTYGYYWSSSLYEGIPNYACNLYINSGRVDWSSSDRYYGLTVRAVFSDNDKPSTFVTLTFNANGGSGTMAAQTFEAGVSQAIAANAFTRSGYTFTGWNTNADGNGTSYTDGQEITLTQDITLYAQWYQEQVVSGTENGHDYVDLGLSVKWATCNVGATTPDGYGDYFAWGETAPKTNYDWSTYKYCNGSSSTLTKYNTESSRGTVDNKTTLEISDDAARAYWGGSWRMPSEAELDELLNNCIWTWSVHNGVEGYKVTSKTNGNSIFLPEAGEWQGASLHRSQGYYRSSSLLNGNSSGACGLRFGQSFVERFDFYRHYGRPVRAVCP